MSERCTHEEWRLIEPNVAIGKREAGGCSWRPFVRHSTVNLMCPPGTTSEALIAEVEAVRKERIGFDAHFPSISVWVGKKTDVLSWSNALAMLDDSTPKMRVVLTWVDSQDIGEACTAALECRSRNLACQLLWFGHSGCCRTAEAMLSRLRDEDLMQNAWFEWLFAADDACEWDQCCNFVEKLDSVGYTFRQQDLSVCGGIAALVRDRILAEFLPPELGSEDRLLRAATAGSSTDLTCAVGAIKALAPDATRNLKCTCQVAPPPPRAIKKAGKIIDMRILRPDDEVLFEDWQYIYDGFEMA